MNNNFSHQFTEYDESMLQQKVASIKQRLSQTIPVSGLTYEELCDMLEQLAKIDIGKFFLINGGANGYWTDYFINFPRDKIASLPYIEQIIFNSEVMTATYQRQQIFKQQNQEKLQNGVHLAAIPSGLMSELLDLDYSSIKNIEITAIDLDQQSLEYSKQKYPDLYAKYTISQTCQDAFEMNLHNRFDLISSNGLTIYIPDDELVAKLFSSFYQALKPGGKLVTSFLTYPASFPDKTEQIYPKNQLKEQIEIGLFVDILQVKWNTFRTTEQFSQLISSVGFSNLKIIPDEKNIFPTVVAYKN